ncbi:nitroreductase family protein [Flagellimonas sp. MMG031]|uniref:Nitroreductase family protein n=1 Tax=Flagellimonas sp. MMG031 TaxID=3158549 RepID=A0AAU7MWV4_9FLAO
MDILKALEWRYATKKFRKGKSLEKSKLDIILKAANLAPTSSGLQPFHVVLISDKNLKTKILPIFRNQIQVSDCSHLLIFAVWDDYTKERINEVYKRIKEARGDDHKLLKGYMDRITYLYTRRSSEINFNHAARQAYISLGFCMETAALLKVDAAPIENFDNSTLDKALGLNLKNLKSMVALCLGYRDTDNDWLVNMKKVRKPDKDFVIEIDAIS